MSDRIVYAEASPAAFNAYFSFSKAVKAGRVERVIDDLVWIRASQLNGCAFCLDMHIKEARLHGESELRLHHVAIWRESPLFSARERAALAWTEIITHLPANGIDDAAYAAVTAVFSPEEVSDLTFAIVAINGWNRLSVAFRTVPGSADRLYGLDKAGLS